MPDFLIYNYQTIKLWISSKIWPPTSVSANHSKIHTNVISVRATKDHKIDKNKTDKDIDDLRHFIQILREEITDLREKMRNLSK